MQPQFLDRLDLFPTPVWRYKFPDFDQKQSSLFKYLNRDDMYFVGAETNGLQITEGNLHDKSLHPDLSDVTDFFQSCFEDVMTKCGYVKDIGITSMWSTRHQRNGYHHEHIHANTFLAGCLYVYDHDGVAGGTIFKNHNAGLHQLQPRVVDRNNVFFKSQEQLDFVVGEAVIFPAWAMHTTPPNAGRYRMVIAANCMPTGRTNFDHYHQYDFPKPSDFGYLPLKEHIASGYGS